MKKLALILFLILLLPLRAEAAFSLDGTANNSALASAAPTVTLSTSHANDVIFMCANIAHTGTNSTITSVSGSSLGSFTLAANTASTFAGNLSCWYKVAASALTSEVITATVASASGFQALSAWGVNGANTTTIFDSNPSIPVEASGFSLPAQYISTTATKTFIIGVGANSSGCFSGVPSGCGPGSGWTNINSGNFLVTEYQIVSSPQTNLQITSSGGGDTAIVGTALILPAAASGMLQNGDF